jgi:hypothetical protein
MQFYMLSSYAFLFLKEKAVTLQLSPFRQSTICYLILADGVPEVST